MKAVINGQGQDTSQFIVRAMLGGNEIALADLYLIGDPGDPNAVYLTDWSSPLKWTPWGTFYPATIPSRGTVKSQIGLEVTTMDFEWSPNNLNFLLDVNQTSPYQKAWLGLYDGMTFRSWTCFMPTPGDADTFGAAELFGGRIGNVVVERGSIKFTVSSFLDVVNQMVPGAVVESTNTIAGFKGASGPGGSRTVPKFTVTSASNAQITGSSGTNYLVGDFTDGFVYMLSGSLSGMWSPITGNAATLLTNTAFNLSVPFPFPPSVGDVFYASATFPNVQGSVQYFGFPFVPAPESAV